MVALKYVCKFWDFVASRGADHDTQGSPSDARLSGSQPFVWFSPEDRESLSEAPWEVP